MDQDLPSPAPDPSDPLHILDAHRLHRVHRLRGWLAAVLSVLLFLVALAVVGVVHWLKPYSARADRIDLSLLDDYDISTVFYDRNGGEIGRLFTENRLLLDEGPIPPIVRDAIIAAEDHRFYQHHGIDWRGLARAAYTDLRHRQLLQGGSTLTQQLSKHLINNFARNLDRKIYESFVAARIEQHFTKDQILRYYLNRVYFGSGYFGVEAAAQGYFGKHARALTVGEAALLMGIVRSPNRNSPRADPKRALWHRDIVLGSMAALKFITPPAAASARLQPLALVADRAPGAADDYGLASARRELDQLLAGADNQEIPQGLKITTTLDPALQREAGRLNQTFLAQLESRLPASGAAKASGPLQSAAVVLDAATGAVRAVIGGRDYRKSQFDRAAMAHRESGALLQPLLYALAFDALRLNPATLLNASFLDLDGAALPGYAKPDTLDTPLTAPAARFVTLQDALSIGSPYAAARVELQLGTAPFADWLALALGHPIPHGDVPSWKRESPTLLETASLYQALANDGRRAAPHFIERIVNRKGDLLYDRAATPANPVLDPRIAQQIALALQPATEEGVARALTEEYKFPVPAAALAGYSPGYRDASFAGFAGGLVGATWVGYDDGRPLGPASLAGETALPLWNDLMRAALNAFPPPPAADASATPIPVPDTLRKFEVDRRSGALVGPGHLAPAPGDSFVYLTPDQSAALSENALPAVAAASTDTPQGASAPAPRAVPADWSDYLGTLIAQDPANAAAPSTAAPGVPAARDPSIPTAAEYRLPALRGAILSAEGAPLALTVQSQNLVIPWPPLSVAADPAAALAWAKTQVDAAGKWLGAPVPLSDNRLRDLYRYQRFQPLVVAEDLQPEQVEAFPKSGLPELGFALQGVPLRAYPQGYLGAHVIGYLRRLQARNPGRYQAGEVMYGDYAGADGIEETFDAQLRGTEGKLVLRTTPDGFTESARVVTPATLGANARTTLRLPLQQIVERALSTVSSGAMVVLDVHTGDVVAMASRPTFDANEFLPVLDAEAWRRLSDPVIHPLQNRATSEEHPPGSVFKTVTSLAAMRAGVLDTHFVFVTDGTFNVGNVQYKIPDEKGSFSYREALARSINVYFFDLGLKVGRDNLIATARELGIGAPTGFVLGEKKGRMPDNEFVLAAHQRSFGPGDVTNTAIGQGDVLMTPIQMARLMEIVANEGTSNAPRIVSAIEGPDGKVLTPYPPQPGLSFPLAAADWRTLKDALQAVTDSGTGRLAQPNNVKLSGKTGTAQVGSKALPRQITWFAGYVPSDRPEYAFAVMSEGEAGADLYAATTAAPIVAQVFGQFYDPTTKPDKSPVPASAPAAAPAETPEEIKKAEKAELPDIMSQEPPPPKAIAVDPSELNQ